MPETKLIRCLHPSCGEFPKLADNSAPSFKTDIFDGIELVDNRWWTIAIEYPNHVKDRPLIFLLQYDERDKEEGTEGAIWCHPEDLDAIIADLTFLRDVLREAAADDAKRVPRPNWGGLMRSSSGGVE